MLIIVPFLPLFLAPSIVHVLFPSTFLSIFPVPSLFPFIAPVPSLSPDHVVFPFRQVLNLSGGTVRWRLREGDTIEVILDQFLKEPVHLISQQVDPLNGRGSTEPEWL